MKASAIVLAVQGAAALVERNVPGAGIDGIKKFKPFTELHKDGFAPVECVKDMMYYHGDKYGDNKHEYNLGDVSGVSIVHYEAHVQKMDRKPMTPAICYQFCRTVENMGFFGIVNGRGCYCTPYYQALASDSSECDSPCDGDNAQMCGGKGKSSIYAMHMCDQTGDNLKEAAGTADMMSQVMGGEAKKVIGIANLASEHVKDLQKAFGLVGDVAVGDLMQDGNVFAGDMLHAAQDLEARANTLADLSKEGAGLRDMSDPNTVTKAERVISDIGAAAVAANSSARTLEALIDLGTEESSKGAEDQYYPLMYFVDKEFADVPTTCTGGKVDRPIYAPEESMCAQACDAKVVSCVGYLHVREFCFLFSSFTSATYYTGCGKASFLQQVKKYPSAVCKAKLASFDGVNLAPQGSGKCSMCLRELEHANRCY